MNDNTIINNMQDGVNKIEENKAFLRGRIGKTLKDLRMKKQKSLTMLCYEYAIPTSSLSYIERGVQDPSITTLWKILETHNLKMSEFFKMVEAEMPPDFSLIEV